MQFNLGNNDAMLRSPQSTSSQVYGTFSSSTKNNLLDGNGSDQDKARSIFNHSNNSNYSQATTIEEIQPKKSPNPLFDQTQPNILSNQSMSSKLLDEEALHYPNTINQTHDVDVYNNYRNYQMYRNQHDQTDQTDATNLTDVDTSNNTSDIDKTMFADSVIHSIIPSRKPYTSDKNLKTYANENDQEKCSQITCTVSKYLVLYDLICVAAILASTGLMTYRYIKNDFSLSNSNSESLQILCLYPLILYVMLIVFYVLVTLQINTFIKKGYFSVSNKLEFIANAFAFFVQLLYVANFALLSIWLMLKDQDKHFVDERAQVMVLFAGWLLTYVMTTLSLFVFLELFYKHNTTRPLPDIYDNPSLLKHRVRRKLSNRFNLIVGKSPSVSNLYKQYCNLARYNTSAKSPKAMQSHLRIQNAVIHKQCLKIQYLDKQLESVSQQLLQIKCQQSRLNPTPWHHSASSFRNRAVDSIKSIDDKVRMHQPNGKNNSLNSGEDGIVNDALSVANTKIHNYIKQLKQCQEQNRELCDQSNALKSKLNTKKLQLKTEKQAFQQQKAIIRQLEVLREENLQELKNIKKKCTQMATENTKLSVLLQMERENVRRAQQFFDNFG